MLKRQSVQSPSRRAPRALLADAVASALPPRAVELLEDRTLCSVSLNSAGWTAITPSADTRIVYVSASAGNDSNTGLSDAAPVKTIVKARTLIRNGSADWMLLRRGDTFHESILQWDKSGRNGQEPVVIGAYGAGDRPLLATGAANGFTTGKAQLNNVYVVGLHFDASSRDPNSPEFVGTGGGSYGVQMLSQSTNVVFEDDVFEKYKTNVAIQKFYGPVTNVQVRRSQILDAYNTEGNAQGLYAEGTDGLTLFENLFDHNGWLDAVAGAGQSQFNHNVYIHSSNNGFSFIGNITANASSHGLQARAGGIVKDNLFLANPIGMSFGLVNGATTKAGGVEGEVSGNVFLGDRAIGTQGRGWALEIGNTKVGGATVVRNNFFAHDTQRLFPAIMLSYGTGGDNAANSVGLNDLTIEGNTVYDWHQGLSTNKNFISGGTGYQSLNDLVVRDNDFQTLSASQVILLNHAGNAAEENWSGDVYAATASPSSWFKINGQVASLDAWKTTVEPTATGAERDYIDPTRTVATYNVTLGGPASLEGFLEKARANSESAWNAAYTASPVIGYVSAGFATKPPPDTTAPTAAATAKNVYAPSGATYTFSVTYADNAAVDAGTLGDDDVTVRSAGGFVTLGKLLAVSTGPGGGCTASYQITPPGGDWSIPDAGHYTILINAGAVKDTSGNAVPAGEVGGFRVAMLGAPPTPPTAPAPTQAPGSSPLSVTSILFVPGGSDKLVIGFSGDVSASLSLDDIVIQRTKAGFQTPLSKSYMKLSYDRGTNQATVTFPRLPRQQLQTANWRLTIGAAGVNDMMGTRLDRDGELLFKKDALVQLRR